MVDAGWVQWIAWVASICEPFAPNATGYESCLTWWFTRSIAAFDGSDLYWWLLSLRPFTDGICMAVTVTKMMLTWFIQTELILGLNIPAVSCVTSWHSGFMVLCGLVLILQGMRGYEKLFQRGGASDTEEPNKNQRRNHEAKANEKRPATSSDLAVVEDHPNALQRRTTNNPVATRTVFTTQF